ncbi:HD domain-containing phosphohydrolase [Halocella sp. SP3-1]|uniref:HD domain-containing phosphohydrolase n=1 Tax=Halocella sp. SP3-1 TaxID=2382161 RepID=UPI00197B0091|nr:HD domain-containing phosphohydrolase [Halocella sp. SP3-1]
MERSLTHIINTKLVYLFIIMAVLMIVFVVTFTNNFVNNLVYQNILKMTVESVYSSLTQFDESLHTMENFYDNLIVKMADDYLQKMEEKGLTVQDMSAEQFDKVLVDILEKHRSELNVLGIDSDIYSNIYYYIINPAGRIVTTNHSIYENADLIEYKDLEGLPSGRFFFQRLTYDPLTELPKKDGYIIFANSYILKFSLPFDVELFDRLSKRIKSIEKDISYVEEIGFYKANYTPVNELFKELTDQDQEYLRRLGEEDSIRNDISAYKSVYYGRWDTRTEAPFTNQSYYLKMKLDFSKHLAALGKTISMVIAIIIFFTILIIFLITRKLSADITAPFAELAASMSQLTNKDLDNIDQNLQKTDIKEINMLLASYQGMTSELSASFEELKAMNEELEASYRESYNLAENLNNVIEVATKLTGIVFDDRTIFLRDLFYVAKQLITEADYGSVYLIDEGENRYIDSIGHDIKKLNNIPITPDYLAKQGTVQFIKDIETEVYDPAFQDIRAAILEAKKPIKSSLVVHLTVGEKIVGGLGFDIAKGSELSFSKHSIETVRAFGNLASAFLTMIQYKNIEEGFQRSIILSIINILEIHDKYTKGHSENVAEISALIAREMNYPEKEIKVIEWAGLVHDIGKILISNSILNKPGRLSRKEFEQIKQHPVWGYEVLVGSDELKEIATYIRHHHERWDGTGYPDQLSGEEIPKIARIIALADSWDTMRSDRVYRQKLSLNTARQELIDNKGTQFDPEIVDIALELIVEGKIK